MRKTTLALALSALIAPGLALAQDEKEARALDTVIVTGTRVVDRTVTESLSPIDVISPELLAQTGTTELATALARVLPSLNFPRPALTDGTSAIRPAQLRGLSPDQVLVLVNGKRRHTSALLNVNGTIGRGSAAADLNAIPISAIAQVEVLRDGASAQYGSDAIAGVVNVVLKGAGEGGSLAADFGQYSAGDGAQYQIGGDSGHSFADGRGTLHVAAQYGHQDRTNRARPFAGTPADNQPELGQKAFVIGDPEVDFEALSLNGEFEISDTVSAYAFGIGSKRDITSFAFFRAPRNANQNIPSIYPDGFLPQINNIARDRSLVAGLRGTSANGWRWDASYNYGYNYLTFHTRNTLNASIGPGSPTSFYSGALELTQNIANLDVSNGFDWGLAYPVSVAFGLEWRNEKWNQSPGEPGSYIQPDISRPGGAQGFAGFSPSVSGHYKRDSWAAYLDMEASLSEAFSLGAAVRYEDYEDFGNQTSGKLSARYDISPALALRSTVSSGFRAPSLAQQYFQTTSTTYLPGISTPFEIRTFPANSAIAQALGAEPLKPEESLSWSLGLVLNPTDALYLTVDAYQIDIDDRIVLSSNLTGDIRQFLEAQGIYGVTGGRYFTNAIDTRTRGVDVVGTWDVDLSDSLLRLSAGYNYSKTEVTRIAPNPDILAANGLNLTRLARDEQGRIESGFPRSKVMLSGDWTRGAFGLTATATRYGSFSTTPTNPANDQTYGAKWVLDLSGSYRLDAWTFALGVDNVLDQYPDENNFANSTNGQFPYSNASPFGFNGAYVWGRVSYDW